MCVCGMVSFIDYIHEAVCVSVVYTQNALADTQTSECVLYRMCSLNTQNALADTQTSMTHRHRHTNEHRHTHTHTDTQCCVFLYSKYKIIFRYHGKH
jgi:hypothetical protein